MTNLVAAKAIHQTIALAEFAMAMKGMLTEHKWMPMKMMIW